MSHPLSITRFILLFLPLVSYGDIVAHYSFDENFNDSSASGNHAILTDVGVQGNSGITQTTGDFVFGGGAMNFSSDRDFLAIPSRTFGSGSAYSIAFWARVNDPARLWNMVIGERGNTNFFIAPNGQDDNLRWRSIITAGGTREVDFNSGVNDTDWHHYAIVATTTGNLSLYLDGALVSTSSNVRTGFILDTIGAAFTDGDFDFEGQLDEVWVFDEALDSSEVAGLFSSNDSEITAPDPMTDPLVTKLIVILQGGQSNADGRANPNGLPTTPINLREEREEIPFFYNIEGGNPTLGNLAPGLSESNQFGPEITLGDSLDRIYRAEAGTKIAIIKYANGGTNLFSDWQAGGDNTTSGDGPDYVVFQQTVTSGLSALSTRFPNATIHYGGMLWVQGESDTINSSVSNAYEANLREFIADIRATYGENLAFFVSRLSTAQTRLEAADLAIVRDAQDTVAEEDSRNFLLDTDSFGMKSDDLHFDSAGQQAIGRAAAELAAYVLWRDEHFSAAQIISGLGDFNEDADGDGRSNEQEFLGNSNPLSSNILFESRVLLNQEQSLVIEYETSVLRSYTIQRLDLTTLDWVNLAPIARGSGNLESPELPFDEETGIFRILTRLPLGIE